MATSDETVIVAVDPVVVVTAPLSESGPALAFHLSPDCPVGCSRAVAVPADTAIGLVSVRRAGSAALWFGKPGSAPVAAPESAATVLTAIRRDLRGDQLVVPTPRRSWLGGREYHAMRRSDS